jgi:putative ABC transport system substrate-binding protein
MNRSSGMTRRQVVQGAGLAGLGLLAACGRLPWQPRPEPPRRPRIGLLYAGDTTDAAPILAQAFQDMGYVEGQNIASETRAAAGSPEVLAANAAELVQLPVDVIVAIGSPATLAARHATTTIPVVQARGAADLVREGVVASLARPGGNVTGLTAIAPELTAKRLQLLKEAVPGLARVAALWNPAFPSAVLSFEEVRDAAQVLGVHLLSLEVRHADELTDLLELATRERVEGLVVLTDAITVTQEAHIGALTAARHLPAIFDRREFTAAGGLMSYGPDFQEMTRRAAAYVDKILKGAQPADLPIERPTRFDFVINLRTAQALGLTIPPHVLLQATEVIQ